jgi:hypothetical protein
VRVGVGSSSALSFRYDLWSVRQVQREQLQAEERFAIAPPTGVSPYGGNGGTTTGNDELATLDDGEIRRPDGHPDDKNATRVAVRDVQPQSETVAVQPAPPPGDSGGMRRPPRPRATTLSTRGGGGGGGMLDEDAPRPSKRVAKADKKPDEPKKEMPNDARVQQGDSKMRQLAQQLTKTNKTIVIEGYADANRADGQRRATDRANIVKNQMIDQGIAPTRIKVVTKVEPGAQERVHIVAQQPTEAEKAAGAPQKIDPGAAPVGESNFVSPTAMTVEKGASAMVSMVRRETEGEVVYLYDAESVRGNDQFAFRAVRFRNPTSSTLETGPVTVYGNTRFIGEGLTEPIPPKASAVVPYALDRQIVVEKLDNESDKLQKLVTIQRGVLTAQVQHIKRRTLSITNRMNEPAKLFIRHTVNKGWSLVDAPKMLERVGDAHLFQIELGPHEVKHVEIAEATPIERTLDLNADVTLDMMRVYVEAPEASGPLKEQLKKLLGQHKTLVDLALEQDSLRRRLADYKERMDELHAQILTLQAVKTGNDLMSHLKEKMRDISNRVQKTTIQIVDQEEKIMLARVQFQDMLGELALGDVTAPALTQAR